MNGVTGRDIPRFNGCACTSLLIATSHDCVILHVRPLSSDSHDFEI